MLGNEVHRNDGSGIFFVSLDQSQGNEIRGNDASGNALNPEHSFASSLVRGTRLPGAADLYDLNLNNLDDAINTGNYGHFGCDPNVWLGNVWGSGGYFPICVTAGGSGPANQLALASATMPAPTTPPELAATRPAPQPPPQLIRAAVVSPR